METPTFQSTHPQGSLPQLGVDYIHILLVEDQGLVRAGLKSLLHFIAANAHVVEVSNYADALAAVDRMSFDLILLDIHLHESASGIDLLHELRQRDDVFKIVMLSGNDDPQTIINCIEAGASGYITKGDGDETIFEYALSTVLSGRIYFPRSVTQRPTHALGGRDLKKEVTLKDYHLAPRMIEVLYYLCQGLPNKTIARRMNISEGTVRKAYVSTLLREFNVTRRTELMIEISRLGLHIPKPLPLTEN